MTKEELAAKLNGREIGMEIMDKEVKEAKENGLLVVFGASDDLVELRGTINDEVSAYDGAMVILSSSGELLHDIDEDDEEVLAKYGLLNDLRRRLDSARKIRGCWDEVDGFSWTFETELPHATFEIMDDDGDDKKFCRGIVVDVKDL